MMTIDVSRAGVQELLSHSIGPEATVGLLDFIEATFATKADLAAAETRLTARIELSEQRLLTTMNSQFATQTRAIIFTMLGSLVGLGALALGLGGLV